MPRLVQRLKHHMPHPRTARSGARHLTAALAASAAAGLLAACADREPTGLAPRAPAAEVSAAATAPTAAPTLTWLAPLGTGAADPATFDAAAAPTVEVCVWVGDACAGAPVARFGPGEGALTANAAAGQYEASWSLMSTAFTTRRTYRIRVLRGTAELGGVSVDVVRGRWALTPADGSVAPLASASALPIRFHVARETLRLYASARGLSIGAAVGYTGTTFPGNAPYVATLRREFNVLVPENILKWQTVRRRNAGDPDYRLQFMDEMVNFAQANGMQVRGHALAWHSGNPPWLDALTPATVSRDSAVALLTSHIATVAGRYSGRVREWDVANEVIRDGAPGAVGSPTDRRPTTESVWERLIGPDWVDIAFRAASAADPRGALFYNDYSIEVPNSSKQNRVYYLVNDLLAKGIRVDGVGFQSHFALGQTPSAAQLKQSFDRFAALGLQVHLTELDITVPAAQQNAAGYAQQAAEYRRVVQACAEHPACGTVVVWGVDDGNSWRTGLAATLFTAAFAPKPAYTSVLDYLAGR